MIEKNPGPKVKGYPSIAALKPSCAGRILKETGTSAADAADRASPYIQ